MMSNKNLYLLSFTLALLGLVSVSYGAAEVVGNFEAGLDGWWAGSNFTLTPIPIAATLGAQAMQVEGPGGWNMGSYLSLKPHRETLGMPGAQIKADITVFNADVTASGMNIEVVINGQNNDDNGANNNVGWQPLGTRDILRDGVPHTYTWAIPDSLTPVLAGVDGSISWYELILVSNLDGSSVRYYVDNIQLVTPLNEEDEKSTDIVIGNWEQDLDGWIIGGNADALYNDQNGVTLGDYSLDIWLGENIGWNQDLLTLDVISAGLLEDVKNNSRLSVDVTRLVDDWPEAPVPAWNEICLVVNAGSDDWSIWEIIGKEANWKQTDGDRTINATYNYGKFFPQMNYLQSVTYFEFMIVCNVDNAYTDWILFYLDNMKLSGAGKAMRPQPENQAKNVLVDSMLSWTPESFAAKHYLYLGTNLNDVFVADLDSDPNVMFVVLDSNSFDPNGLEFNTQYFWRVDEVNESHPDSPWKGEVWNFTTAHFIVVDDFESYNIIDPGQPGSNRIFEAWSDGWQNETNGALVGHEDSPYTEPTIVRNGIQSMPLYFDNTGAALQSEAQRIWAEPQDWTFNGYNPYILTLYTFGDAANTSGELYVIIEDSKGVSSRLTNSSAELFTNTEEWMEWKIPVDDVIAAGVNMTAVTKLVIGIADLPGQDEAKGILYIDDILGYVPVVISLEPDHLVVHETTTAPVIDGQWDAVWDDVNETRCLITEIVQNNSVPPEDANDLSVVFKALFDDNRFYIFVEVQDSVIDHEFSDWQGDGVEIYFDGDYSHGDVYDGINDNQIRFTVDDVAQADIDSSLPVDGTEFKIHLTDSGYNLEASFPLDVLQIFPSQDPDPVLDADGIAIPNSGIARNNIIGFEVQVNDNDSGSGRETIMRWHSDNDDSWQNPSLFGQARLMSESAND